MYSAYGVNALLPSVSCTNCARDGRGKCRLVAGYSDGSDRVQVFEAFLWIFELYFNSPLAIDHSDGRLRLVGVVSLTLLNPNDT